MDFAQVGVELSREEELISTKMKLESFQFRRMDATVPSASLSSVSSFGRPHSRHGSVSSLSFSGSISGNSLGPVLDQPSLPSSDSRPSSFAGRPRPTSHHRRRSSVSTRVESAEMMGITLPELPTSSSDDNINFGDKDSVRRRALQALEGRNDLGSYNSTVEIPEFTNQVVPKPFEREFKLPANGLPFGLPPPPGKRDSFGKFLSSASSLKDQLHTLMEEEEEEEEEMLQEKNEGNPSSTIGCSPKLLPNCEEKPILSDRDGRNSVEHEHSAGSAEVSVSHNLPSTPGASRTRPANLALRPLSLVSSVSSPSLPTPSVTPSAQPGIRSFSSVPHPDPPSNNLPEVCDTGRSNGVWRQNSDIHSNSSSLSSTTSSHSMSGSNPKRQSSISYIRSVPNHLQPTTFTFASLPTPGATPTSEKRQSTSSISSFGSFSNQDKRNMSEDVFLHQSHASLLTRIAELEHALQCRSRSRPISLHSDNSTDPSEPPDDEMLQLVADLKAERDELNRDIEGWRQRVKDLERAKTSLGHEKVALERRLEAEKRERWIKDERLGLLETEKDTLNRQLVMKDEELTNIARRLESTQTQLHQAHLECDSLREDAEISKRQMLEAQRLLEARKGTEAELRRVHEALRAEQLYREKLISQLDAAGVLETPRVTDSITGGAARPFGFSEQPRSGGLGFQSIDSACTTVDAEESHQVLSAPFTLKAIEEESEVRDDCLSDEEDELARYEEEDNLMINLTSPTRSMSSSGSEDEFPRSLSHLRLAANGTPVPSSDFVMMSKSPSSTPSPTSSPCPTPVPPVTYEVGNPSHSSRASLSKTWTFPRGGQPPSLRLSPQEVDRFFGCLEDDVDTSPPVGSFSSMDERSIFSQRLQFGDVDDEDLPPFVLPTQKGVGGGTGRLDVIFEEDQNGESEYEGPDDRRKTSLPVSVNEESLSRMSSPLMDDQIRTNSVSPVFSQSLNQRDESQTIKASIPNSGGIHSHLTGPSYDAADNCPSGQKVTNPRTNRPSRIPPPSPPRFFHAKALQSVGKPSAPLHNAGPAQTANVTPASPSRLKPIGAPVVSPRGVKKVPVSTHDEKISSFPPSSEIQKPTVGNVPGLSATTVGHDNDATFERHGSNKAHLLSSRPLLQAFTTFLPLPSFSWVKTGSEAGPTTRQSTFVPKERQLARLRAGMKLDHNRTLRLGGIAQCNGCGGDLISL